MNNNGEEPHPYYWHPFYSNRLELPRYPPPPQPSGWYQPDHIIHSSAQATKEKPVSPVQSNYMVVGEDLSSIVRDCNLAEIFDDSISLREPFQLELIFERYISTVLTGTLACLPVTVEIKLNDVRRYNNAKAYIALRDVDGVISVHLFFLDHATLNYTWKVDCESFIAIKTAFGLTLAYNEFASYLSNILSNVRSSPSSLGTHETSYGLIMAASGNDDPVQLLIQEFRMKRSMTFLKLESKAGKDYASQLALSAHISTKFQRLLHHVLTTEISSLLIQQEDYEKRILSMQEQLALQAESFSSNIKLLERLNNDLDNIKAAKAALESDKMQSDNALLLAKAEASSYISKINTLQETISLKEETHIKFVTLESAGRSKIEALENELSQVNAKLREYERGKNNLKAIIDEGAQLRVTNIDLLSQLSDTQAELRKLQSEASEFAMERSHVLSTKRSNDALTLANNKLTERVDALETQLRSITNDSISLKEKLDSSECEKSALAAELDKQKLEMRSLNLHFARRLLEMQGNQRPALYRESQNYKTNTVYTDNEDMLNSDDYLQDDIYPSPPVFNRQETNDDVHEYPRGYKAPVGDEDRYGDEFLDEYFHRLKNQHHVSTYAKSNNSHHSDDKENRRYIYSESEFESPNTDYPGNRSKMQ